MERSQEPPLREEDYRRLEALRAGWLADGRRESRWRDARDLELFDRTFGRRVAWKWRAALAEAREAGVAPPEGVWLDFGCGTAVATRAVLAAFPAARPARVLLVDSSPLARQAARAALAAERPGVEIEALAAPPPSLAPDLLLVSHVAGELDEAGLREVLELARASGLVLWVEPGDRPTALRVCEVREALLATHAPLAPCPHRRACGVLAPGAERQWCHRFAAPDPEVFTSGLWARLCRRLGIDRRSLPFASLALLRREPAAEEAFPEEGSDGAAATAAGAHAQAAASAVAGEQPPGEAHARVRPLGRPKVGKGHLLMSVCTAEGVRRVRLLEREDRRLFRDLARGAAPVLEGVLDGERLRFPRRAAVRSMGPDAP